MITRLRVEWGWGLPMRTPTRLTRHTEREHCAEMLKDVIMTLDRRYLDVSSPYGRQDVTEAMLELKAKVDGLGD
jgi:hypothetical protein